MPTLPTAMLRWTTTDISAAIDADQMLATDAGITLCPGTSEATVVVSGQPPQPFMEAVASWQGDAPTGTTLEVALRARVGDRWTRWWTMGVWSADQEQRHSVDGQHDDDGSVSTDTLQLRHPADALEYRVVLRGSGATPILRGLAVMTTPAERSPVPDLPNPVEPLAVPLVSQMEFEGGNIWCSPVSLTMVLHYWHERLQDARLAPFAAPNAAVQVAVPAIYDPVYDGTGNWPFNTAYASSFGLDAYVARFETLAEVAAWTEAGIPVIASISWEPGTLDNAAVEHSGGHLLVVVGFTRSGDVIVNDPAAKPSEGESVRRVYQRDQFKRAWQRKGFGTVYLIFPPSPA